VQPLRFGHTLGCEGLILFRCHRSFLWGHAVLWGRPRGIRRPDGLIDCIASVSPRLSLGPPSRRQFFMGYRTFYGVALAAYQRQKVSPKVNKRLSAFVPLQNTYLNIHESIRGQGEERRGEEDTFVKCLLHWATVQGSSAAAGRGSEDRRGGGAQSGSTQRGHKVSLIVLRSGQRAA
jgi:hypothetical protein